MKNLRQLFKGIPKRLGQGLSSRRCQFVGLLLVLTIFVSGCATPAQTAALGIAGVTALGASTPGHEIEQIYYVGVFDPMEQLPPSVYRITVRGQASILSSTKFASGWAPAPLIDSLEGNVRFAAAQDGNVEYSEVETDMAVGLGEERRFMMFGPEGFREAPRGHRLVIVMGADPSAFFDAIDGALGSISDIQRSEGNTKALLELKEEYESLRKLQSQLFELRLKAASQLDK